MSEALVSTGEILVGASVRKLVEEKGWKVWCSTVTGRPLVVKSKWCAQEEERWWVSLEIPGRGRVEKLVRAEVVIRDGEPYLEMRLGK